MSEIDSSASTKTYTPQTVTSEITNLLEPPSISRDLPKSFGSFFKNPFNNLQREIVILNKTKPTPDDDDQLTDEQRILQLQEQEIQQRHASLSKTKKYLPIITTGAGLFSDGYINNSIGTVSTILSILYPVEYKDSGAIKNVNSLAFVGIVVGQISFGFIADYYSRRAAMLWGTIILIIFTILASASWGHNANDVTGMLTALTVWRVFMGVGLGSEYPAASTACAEASLLLPAAKRNRYFAWFTNTMIDLGFLTSAIVPTVLVAIFGDSGSWALTRVWRLTLGLGAIPPVALLVMRFYYKESESFNKHRFKRVKVPYWRVIKFYWFRLLVISSIWFIYDFCAYGFGLFSSHILAELYHGDSLSTIFQWNILFNAFYLPGAILGAWAADYFGPRLTLVVGVTLQSIVGYIMAGTFGSLTKNVAGFVVAYGIFMTLGEFGPGDNIGLLASKTCASAIRGQYYGICAALGKVGAFIGVYCFTPLIDQHGTQSAWWLASSLGIFAAVLAFFLLPAVDQDAMTREDELFMEYLKSTGFDTSLIGLEPDIECCSEEVVTQTEYSDSSEQRVNRKTGFQSPEFN
ncbi:hypothetical protein WICPIJ_003769 [Wickerhamomyces pijperi]|uniref:Major facilitator superfamily (MFS) profile domain-containing protein n=1 Tax=Wickerhamomyces pijperi TaxID=599730 RepID=A0A9P8TNL4_WICPI|nr:hypothetical protein WICPIJ_003769 [Wickerhamomyces pijperi]